MTADEQVALVRAAFAEAGYPDAGVAWIGDRVMFRRGCVPPEVAWRGGVVLHAAIGEESVCFPCFQAEERDCDHDIREGAPPVVRPARSA